MPSLSSGRFYLLLFRYFVCLNFRYFAISSLPVCCKAGFVFRYFAISFLFRLSIFRHFVFACLPPGRFCLSLFRFYFAFRHFAISFLTAARQVSFFAIPIFLFSPLIFQNNSPHIMHFKIIDSPESSECLILIRIFR